jgi:hypothetical protein
MRRLQCNLAYLAAIADRSHKPSSQIPAHPAIISAPPPSQKPAQAGQTTPSTSSPTTKKEDSSSSTSEDRKPEADAKKPEEMEEERALSLGDLYKKLQALFPGVDPKKEPPLNSAARNQAQQQQMQAHKQNAAAVQGNQSMNVGVGGDATAQQKAQNDLLRHKMMQQQAQQQAAVQNQQGHLQSR